VIQGHIAAGCSPVEPLLLLLLLLKLLSLWLPPSVCLLSVYAAYMLLFGQSCCIYTNACLFACWLQGLTNGSVA